MGVKPLSNFQVLDPLSEEVSNLCLMKKLIIKKSYKELWRILKITKNFELRITNYDSQIMNYELWIKKYELYLTKNYEDLGIMKNYEGNNY